jgi:hypothetical protein
MSRLVWRLLASHDLALVLLALLGLAVLAGGTLPQAGRMSPADFSAWYNDWPTLAVWSEFLGLNRVFGSIGFLILCITLLINMTAGMVVSVSRRSARYRGDSKPSLQASGEGLPPRPLPPLLSRPVKEEGAVLIKKGLLGLLGIPLFHLGIGIIVLGGIWSGYEGFGAHFELREGGAFSGQPEQLGLSRGSFLPTEFGASLRLDRAEVEVTDGKYLKERKAHLSVQQQGGPVEQAVVEINHPLSLGGYRLYPDKTQGYSALFERILPGGARQPMSFNFPAELSEWEQGSALGRTVLVEQEGVPLYYEMTLIPGASPLLDLIVRQGNREIINRQLRPGEMVDLGIYHLVFRGSVRWMGFYLASDRPMFMVFGGFVITLLGYLMHLLVCFRRVEVVVTPAGWEARAWARRDDLEFNRQWATWQSRLDRDSP